ncbi:unnamed protein product [Somion occarium]|uniref:Membrane insertase YidC/Oxa/ALB C-terminal domain-containing protein n=1 Tax=Somion occarium TaxID=3059160 RepID=A0ABP1CU65_9APHY
MLVGSATCASGRLRAPALLGARLPRHVNVSSHSRLLSSAVLQHARSSALRKDFYGLPGNARSYWWSSSKTPVDVSASTSPSTQSADALSNTLPISQPPPVESVAVVDSSVVSEASQASGTQTVVDGASIASDVISSVPAVLPSPMNYGDLAALGLISWSPAGVTRWGMEALHVSTGLPWGWTIVAATVLTRVVLFPFSVMQLRNTARMAPHQAEINALREELNQARGNKLAIQRAMLKQQMLNKKMGVNMLSVALTPFIQLPVTLGMFFGVKKLCDIGLEQLKTSGWEWLPNLTLADPTFILPIATTVVMNMQLSLGLRDMQASPAMPHMINLFRAISVLSIGFMINLPSGVLVYLLTSIISMSAQTAILRLAAVRRLLGIPVLTPGQGVKSASIKESIDFAKNWWRTQKREAEAKARAERRR